MAGLSPKVKAVMDRLMGRCRTATVSVTLIPAASKGKAILILTKENVRIQSEPVYFVSTGTNQILKFSINHALPIDSYKVSIEVYVDNILVMTYQSP